MFLVFNSHVQSVRLSQGDKLSIALPSFRVLLLMSFNNLIGIVYLYPILSCVVYYSPLLICLIVNALVILHRTYRRKIL